MNRTYAYQNVFEILQNLPKHLQQEITDFAEFVAKKYQTKTPKKKKSNLGSAKGLIIMSEDFDEPLEDFKEYMP